MSYERIDPILQNVANINKYEIFIGNGDRRRRYFYISSGVSGLVQVVIQPEYKGIVRIDAHEIEGESNNFHLILSDSIENFESLLKYCIDISILHMGIKLRELRELR